LPGAKGAAFTELTDGSWSMTFLPIHRHRERGKQPAAILLLTPLIPAGTKRKVSSGAHSRKGLSKTIRMRRAHWQGSRLKTSCSFRPLKAKYLA